MILVVKMSIPDHRTEVAPTIRLGLWLVGMLMLIAFPLQRSHSSLSHFRTHEVRRSVLRHTSLERTHYSGTLEQASKIHVDFIGPTETYSGTQVLSTKPTIPDIPVTVFLTRLKLGHSQDSGKDPLL
jgi:hypothetical protein